jgi:hypothetical protein
VSRYDDPRRSPAAPDGYRHDPRRGTRVTLDTVISEYPNGVYAGAIAEAYDVLSPADAYATIACLLRNRAAVDEYLRGNERQGEELRRRYESMPENQAWSQRINRRRELMRVPGGSSGTPG